MTGLELLEGLSFVDERFIAEAETAKLGRNVPWMKVLSVAACLCILIVGAFALENFGHKGALEEAAPEAAAPQAAPEAAPEAAEEEAVLEMEGAPLATDEERKNESAAAEKEPTDELQHIPSATLRIISVEDDRWVAVVEELPDEPVALQVGMEVTVIIDTGKVPETDRDGDAMFGGIPLPAEGLLAKIENGAYDASTNILYITGANLEEPTD